MKPFDIALAGETNVDLLFHRLPENLPADREAIS